jgi:hypothetical protein
MDQGSGGAAADDFGVIVLGLPDFPGERRIKVRAGTDEGLMVIMYAYTPHDGDAPTLVLAERLLPRPPGIGIDAELPLLLGPRGLDAYDPARTSSEDDAVIDGVPTTVIRHHYTEPRLTHAEFPWRGHYLSVLGWDTPLSAELLGQLRPMPA